MSKIIVFVSFYPKKDKKDEVKKIIQSMVNPTRSEKDNEFYNFYEKKMLILKIFLFTCLRSIKILIH